MTSILAMLEAMLSRPASRETDHSQFKVNMLINYCGRIYNRIEQYLDESALIRALLLDGVVADQLDEAVIEYLFMHPEGRKQAVNRPNQPPILLRQLILDGLTQHESNPLSLSPNWPEDLTPLGKAQLRTQFDENTQQVLTNIRRVYEKMRAQTSPLIQNRPPVTYTLIEQLALFGSFKVRETAHPEHQHLTSKRLSLICIEEL